MSDTNPSPASPPRRRFGFAAIAVALAAGLAIGGGAVLFERSRHDGHDHGNGPATAEQKPKYVCPMHPTVVSDHPGDCPICGMKLVLAPSSATAAPAKAEGK